jgi:hypothetical protein
VKRQALGQSNILGREEHRRPRGRAGTHPGRILLVWNVETPFRSAVRRLRGGKPTARKAQLLERDRMTQKRMPVRRKATGNRRPQTSASTGVVVG